MSFIENCFINRDEYERKKDDRLFASELTADEIYSFMLDLMDYRPAKTPVRLESEATFNDQTGLYVARIAFVDMDLKPVLKTHGYFDSDNFFVNKTNLSVANHQVKTGYVLEYDDGLDVFGLGIPDVIQQPGVLERVAYYKADLLALADS